MNIKWGLAQLKTCLTHHAPDGLPNFHTLEARWNKNENDELIFGSSENTRNERSQIMYALNTLSLAKCDTSFNELCEEEKLTSNLVHPEGDQRHSKSRFSKGAKGQAASGSSKVYHGTGKAWAVLVGINHYECDFIHSLKVCVDDVKAIHQALSGSYEVTKLLTDAARADILGGLSTVAQAAGEDDLLLFYFSGHGMAQNGESYLLARDTQLSALKHTAIAMKDIRELIEQSSAHAKVIVLDACHSGASIGKAEPVMTPEFIQRVFEQAEGMAVLASCKENQQSWEWGEKRRSVFTYYLLDALTGKADFEKKGFVTVSDTSNYVSNGVKMWAAQRGVPQTPTLQYTVAGDIILLQYGESHL